MNRLTPLLEAALFSAAHPLTLDELARLDPEASRDEVRIALDALRRRYDEPGHGIELIQLAEGYQILSRREYADQVAEAQVVSRPRRLSPAALETLAIIAYRQPVSRSEIEEIRGVSVEWVLRSLQERELIEPVGRADGLGRPILYGTTPAFLERVGLRTVDELPRLDELSVALRPPTEIGE